MNATYLVFMGTGRQGRATINALQAKGVTNIVITSRNPESASSKSVLEAVEAVQKVLPAELTDPVSVAKAISDSKASHIWFTTDFNSLKNPTREKEFLTGKAVIDGIVQHADQIQHVVYSSVGDADNCPESIQHFWSKADVERYMKTQLAAIPQKITLAIIRPVAFFDNLDDPKNWNPLTKGSVSFLGRPDRKYKWIATEDIGKGSAELLMHPEVYDGTTLEAAGGEHNGPELAAALTEASGVPCTYKTAVPRFVVWLFLRDLYHMINWLESDGYTADIEAFKKVVPDAMDAKAWFTRKGKWSNGEKFQEKK